MEEEDREFERIREFKEMQFNMTADQIRQLAAMNQEGILTDEEFTAKKQELLSRL